MSDDLAIIYMAIFNGWNIILDCLYLLKFIAINITSRQNTPLFEKVLFRWLHIGALNVHISSGRLNRSGSICPNCAKNRNLGRLVCAVRFENEIKQLLQEQFQLENQSAFSKKCCDSISYPQQRGITAV